MQAQQTNIQAYNSINNNNSANNNSNESILSSTRFNKKNDLFNALLAIKKSMNMTK